MSMLSVGDEAPDFELLSDENRPVKLSDFRGRRVVLFFFPRAATPGCTTQACGFRDRFPQIQAADAVVIGVGPDKPKAMANWKKKENLPYTLLSDPDHAVTKAYGAWGEKKMYGKAYDGILRSHVVIGADGRIEDVRYKISPTESVEAAVERLSQ